jgi:hypothetical protein
MDEILTQFTKAIEIIQRSGAVVKEINVDRKTMDRLWFDMNQRDIRHRAETKRKPYFYISIHGVSVNESQSDQRDDVASVLTPEILAKALSRLKDRQPDAPENVSSPAPQTIQEHTNDQP